MEISATAFRFFRLSDVKTINTLTYNKYVVRDDGRIINNCSKLTHLLCRDMKRKY